MPAANTIADLPGADGWARASDPLAPHGHLVRGPIIMLETWEAKAGRACALTPSELDSPASRGAMLCASHGVAVPANLPTC